MPPELRGGSTAEPGRVAAPGDRGGLRGAGSPRQTTAALGVGAPGESGTAGHQRRGKLSGLPALHPPRVLRFALERGGFRAPGWT